MVEIIKYGTDPFGCCVTYVPGLFVTHVPGPNPPALRSAWIQDADERMMAFRDGGITAVDGPQAMAELRSRFS